MTGVSATFVNGRSGQVSAGGLTSPTNTIFQFPPFHPPMYVFLKKYCCCEPELIVPSILESAMNPPLDQPPSSSTRFPLICMRRNGVACDVAHRLVPLGGVTDIPATDLQKVQVALPFIQSASE